MSRLWAWSRGVPRGVDDGDEIEQAGERAEEGADLVWFGDGDGVRREWLSRRGRGRREQPAGVWVGGFHGLVEVIDAEGDGADEGLSEEPPLVFASIDDVDAADEEPRGEETEDAEGDEQGATGLCEDEMSESWEREREHGGHGFCAFGGMGGGGHSDGGRDAVDRGVTGSSVPPDRGPTGVFATVFGGNAEALGMERTAMLLLDETMGLALLEEESAEDRWDVGVEVVMEEEEDEDDDFLDDDDDDDDDDDEDDEFLDDDDEFLEDDEEDFEEDDDVESDDEDL